MLGMDPFIVEHTLLGTTRRLFLNRGRGLDLLDHLLLWTGRSALVGLLFFGLLLLRLLSGLILLLGLALTLGREGRQLVLYDDVLLLNHELGRNDIRDSLRGYPCCRGC